MGMGLGTALRQGVKDLYPGYFSLVMATGIVSIDAYLLDAQPLAIGLFAVNVVAYATLWLLTLARLVAHAPRMRDELASRLAGPAFFTMVAGTCILGSQMVILFRGATAGLTFWLLGVLLWLGLTYGFFAAVIVDRDKSASTSELRGAWLLTVVATQSISILATLLAPTLAGKVAELLFVSLLAWLTGFALYSVLIALIAYRLLCYPLTPEGFTPDYWITMGAAAISTLAGARLLLASPHWAFLGEVLPFLKGLTVLCWIVATWWIPLLVALAIWRRVRLRLPIRYHPAYWSTVFPLGMYAAATRVLEDATNLPFLADISRGFTYVALLAWTAVALGLVRALLRRLVPLASSRVA